jgi:hypothetical protein
MRITEKKGPSSSIKDILFTLNILMLFSIAIPPGTSCLLKTKGLFTNRKKINHLRKKRDIYVV